MVRRDLFDEIYREPEGLIFLLNLVASKTLGHLSDAELADYFREIESVGNRTRPRWWLQAIKSSLVSSSTPTIVGVNQFVTIVALTKDEVDRADPVDVLYGGTRTPHKALDMSVVSEITAMKHYKKVYWISEIRSVQRAESPDDVRDLLGLEWVDANMHLYHVVLDGPLVQAASPRRPTGLCRGSSRFKVRRYDEAVPRAYPGWGRTLHLAAWRSSRNASSFTRQGAAELVVEIGPLPPASGRWRYVGSTSVDSQSNDDIDHGRFARALNEDNDLDPDELYRSLT